MLPEVTFSLVFFLVCMGAYTIAAAIWDIRFKKIPNKLTIPVFGVGIVYQAVFNGLPGLLDGGLGFLLGFGLLFLLWMIGSGGGGDVKLMGALSVWLGFRLTLMVLVSSTLLAAFGTLLVIIKAMFSKGVYATKDQYLATGKTPKGKKPKKETLDQRLRRRPMGYAVPVALATWLVVVWQLPEYPWVGNENAEPEVPAQVSSAN